jgi:hypothetical protein
MMQPPAAASHHSPADQYLHRRAAAMAERDGLEATWNRLANVRLVAGLAVIAFGAWGLWGRNMLGWWLALAALVAFIALATAHNRIGRRRDTAALAVLINDDGIARVARDWDALPPRWEAVVPPDHAFAGDLDLFGRASLSCLLGTVSTGMGWERLRGWLMDPADPETVLARQARVGDLAPRLDWRQQFERLGRASARDGKQTDPEPFLAWAEGEPWLAKRRWLLALAWIGPVMLVLLAAGQAVGLVSAPLWPLALVFNLVVAGVLGREAGAIAGEVGQQARALSGYAGQLALVDEIDHGIAGHGDRAGELAKMARLAGMPLPAGSPAGALVTAVTCWDVHVLAAMERWQARHGQDVRGWFGDLAETDAISGLAALTFDNPSWPFPLYGGEQAAFTSRSLGHPLLQDDARKTNDVTVGPAGSFLLVTGSNMSGKSTLLRSIGINAVLAGAGGPVCAASLAMPPVNLWTSVRVQDSLERGVSFFMAELQRLKLVVDAADRARADGGAPVLYLLDEILQGTNTAERQIAARRIIRHLVETGAIGAVSTHDLALGDEPELAAAAVPVHFRDEVRDDPDGMEMRFDRILRPGIATTTNALRLMELIGLKVD